MAGAPPVWSGPPTGSGEGDVVAVIVGVATLAGLAITSYLSVRGARRQEGSATNGVKGSLTPLDDREPTSVS